MSNPTRQIASASVRLATLIVSWLAVTAIGTLPAAMLSQSVASAEDITHAAEPSLPAVPLARSDAAAQVRIGDAYGKLPLHFEINRGQTAPQVEFLSRSSRHTLFLGSKEAVLVLTKPEQRRNGEGNDATRTPKIGDIRTVLRMTFLGANPNARVAGQDELPGKANYFIGNDPAKWRINVATYARVYYQDLYPGIDLLYYGNQRQLEYDFVVHPGAHPGLIALGFQGADKLEVDAQGDLVLYTPLGPIRQRRPVIYQDVDGVRKEIPGGYVLKGADQVGFQVAAYDLSRPLVIDPVLFYSTYVGGTGNDTGGSVAVDTAGNAYITGNTNSLDFPTAPGAFQIAYNGGLNDVFVTKLNPTGSGLVYSTYLGGSGNDEVRGGGQIVVDATGSAYVAGLTDSLNFPTTLGAFQLTSAGGADAFVTKLDPSGSILLYSTYLGGSNDDGAAGITVDAVGSAYVAGFSNSSNFPTTVGAFQTTRVDFQEGFVTKLNPVGSGLVYSTYHRGTNGISGVALDAAGNAYVTGETNLTNLPTTLGAFQPSNSGGADAYVSKLNPSGSGLVYATYLGGSGRDGGVGIAVDTAGNAYVSGATQSPNFPTTLGAFQTSTAGGTDAYVAKVNPFGTGLVYSTYLGGSGLDQALAIAIDSVGNAYVTGSTQSANFPIVPGAFQTTNAGGFDAFVTKLNPFGTGLVYSTYLGGSGDDHGVGIAVDALPNPNAYVTGLTLSTNFPTTPGAFDTTFNGLTDAFVAKIIDIVLPPPPTEGKVTGGGSINVAGGDGTFGFVVQRKETGGPVKGDLQYVNHASGDEVHSVAFDSLVITGNMATFGGTCTINKVTPCTFRSDVTDNGEPGTTDSFVISVTPGSTEGGMLRSGNIQIHK